MIKCALGAIDLVAQTNAQRPSERKALSIRLVGIGKRDPLQPVGPRLFQLRGQVNDKVEYLPTGGAREWLSRFLTTRRL